MSGIQPDTGIQDVAARAFLGLLLPCSFLSFLPFPCPAPQNHNAGTLPHLLQLMDWWPLLRIEALYCGHRPSAGIGGAFSGVANMLYSTFVTLELVVAVSHQLQDWALNLDKLEVVLMENSCAK